MQSLGENTFCVSQLKLTLKVSQCVSSAPILRGPIFTQGKPSLTVCASVRIAMMLSVGVSLTDATHVDCGLCEGGGPLETLSQFHRERCCSRR